jgi:preprotein translocase subunit YajC
MRFVLDALRAQAGDAPAAANPLTQLLPFLAIAVVFYFIFFRPQQKQQKQHQVFLQGLKRGDEVVTQGGIIGEVVAVEDRVVTLNVGGGTKVRMLKAQVAGQWKEGPAAEQKPEKK